MSANVHWYDRHFFEALISFFFFCHAAAPGAGATAAAGTLGTGDQSREEAGEDASKWEKKRKMSSTATPEMTQDTSSTPSTRSVKVARKD